MKAILIISLLTILRLGIPTITLMLISEAVKKHYENMRTL